MSERHSLEVVVNGTRHKAEIDPRLLLADFLRDELNLVGVHLGCEHGVCGACTVLMNGESIRSCITLALQATGAEILTIEGLGAAGRLHPLQESFWEKQGLQCGYCTPAMILRAYELLRQNPNPTPLEVRECISSNLCRCTGYQFIIDAVLHAAPRVAASQSPSETTPTEVRKS